MQKPTYKNPFKSGRTDVGRRSLNKGAAAIWVASLCKERPGLGVEYKFLYQRGGRIIEKNTHILYQRGGRSCHHNRNSVYQRGGRNVRYILYERSGRAFRYNTDSLYERGGRTIRKKYIYHLSKGQPLLPVKCKFPLARRRPEHQVYPL